MQSVYFKASNSLAKGASSLTVHHAEHICIKKEIIA